MADALTQILLACVPKSGSTYLCKALATYLKVPVRGIQPCMEIQTIAPNILNIHHNVCPQSYISQVHVLPTYQVEKLIKNYQMKVIVLERNILDCLVSALDGLDIEHLDTWAPEPGVKVWQEIFVGQSGLMMPAFYQLDRKSRLDYLIENMLVWYIKFHIAWKVKANHFGKHPVYIRYEQLFADFRQGFATLLKDLELYNDEAYSCFNIPAKKTGDRGHARFNQGVNGRGQQALTERQLRRVHEIIDIFERANKLSLRHLIDPDDTPLN